MKKLTKMQQQVYDFIVRTIREQGYAPSVREIGEALGLKSPSTVHFHVKHLQELGLIDKGAGKGRAIALKQDAAPAAETAPVRVAPREESELPRRQVPILGNVAAGSPILAQECIEEVVSLGMLDKDAGAAIDDYNCEHFGIKKEEIVRSPIQYEKKGYM